MRIEEWQDLWAHLSGIVARALAFAAVALPTAVSAGKLQLLESFKVDLLTAEKPEIIF